MSLGATRLFVVGQRAVVKAANTRQYSLALANTTTHYFRITCGVAQATGTFTTGNIALGSTYADVLPTDPLDNNGLYNYPSLDWSDRTERIVDPLTGADIRKVTLPNDFAETATNRSVGACSGSHWVKPESCASLVGTAASYAGATQDILYAPAIFTSANGTKLVDRLNVSLRASISGTPGGDDKFLDICMTVDGRSCASPWKAIDLTTCSSSSVQGDCKNLGSREEMDFWGAATPIHGWVAASTEGFLIKPRMQGQYTISISGIQYTAKTVGMPGFPAHAGQPMCSFVPIVEGGTTFYLCYTQTARKLYSVDVTNGRAYYLGPIVLQTPLRTISEIVFDQKDPRVFYAVQQTENYLLKGTWSAASGAITQEHNATSTTGESHLDQPHTPGIRVEGTRAVLRPAIQSGMAGQAQQ